MHNELSVREIEESDLVHICNYWLNSEQDYLVGMGVDLNKIPSREDLIASLTEQVYLPYLNKLSYAIIWELNGVPVGHCNVDKIDFGNSAFLHLHFWNLENRGKGMASSFVKLCIPYFFHNLKLKTIYCEPFFQNKAPHVVLEKCNFIFEQDYITTPGSLNFEQKVKRWALEAEI